MEAMRNDFILYSRKLKTFYQSSTSLSHLPADSVHSM